MKFGIFWQVPGYEGSSVPDRHWETVDEIERSNISINNIKWGKGFGIVIKSPFGPVRLDYSNPLNNKNFKNGKLNLGLLYIF